MKNSNDTIGYRNCDLRACRAVPQPTAPQLAHEMSVTTRIYQTTRRHNPAALILHGRDCVSHLYKIII